MTAVKSKAHLSLKGEPEQTTTAVGDQVESSQDIPPNMSMSTVYISFDVQPAASITIAVICQSMATARILIY